MQETTTYLSDWLTTEEARKIMQLESKTTVAQYCREGKLHCRKHNRDWLVWRVDAENFVKSHVGRKVKS